MQKRGSGPAPGLLPFGLDFHRRPAMDIQNGHYTSGFRIKGLSSFLKSDHPGGKTLTLNLFRPQLTTFQTAGVNRETGYIEAGLFSVRRKVVAPLDLLCATGYQVP